jgi:hypothetical protein
MFVPTSLPVVTDVPDPLIDEYVPELIVSGYCGANWACTPPVLMSIAKATSQVKDKKL